MYLQVVLCFFVKNYSCWLSILSLSLLQGKAHICRNVLRSETISRDFLVMLPPATSVREVESVNFVDRLLLALVEDDWFQELRPIPVSVTVCHVCISSNIKELGDSLF